MPRADQGAEPGGRKSATAGGDCAVAHPTLNETQTLIRDTARKIVERELKPHVEKLEHQMELGGGTTEIQELTIARQLIA